MSQKKINFGRTTIARAKAAVKRHRAAKKKKGPINVDAGEEVIRFSRSRPEPVIQREPRSTGTR